MTIRGYEISAKLIAYVVGTVNTYDAANGNSGSVELRGTGVCNS